MLLKAVCLTSASLAVHSNAIDELQKLHELQNQRINESLSNSIYILLRVLLFVIVCLLL